MQEGAAPIAGGAVSSQTEETVQGGQTIQGGQTVQGDQTVQGEQVGQGEQGDEGGLGGGPPPSLAENLVSVVVYFTSLNVNRIEESPKYSVNILYSLYNILRTHYNSMHCTPVQWELYTAHL